MYLPGVLAVTLIVPVVGLILNPEGLSYPAPPFIALNVPVVVTGLVPKVTAKELTTLLQIGLLLL